MNPKLKKFISYYRPYRRLFIAVLFAALISSLAALLIPLCTRFITGELTGLDPKEAAGKILAAGGVMAVLVLINRACDSFMDYRGHVMGAAMERDIRDKLYSHYLKLSFIFFDNRKVGELLSRLTGDLQNLAELYHHGPEDLIFFSLRFLGAFAIMFFINSQLALIVAAFIPVLAVFTLFMGKRMRLASKKSYESIAEVNSTAEDCLSGIRVVKSFAGEEREAEKFGKKGSLFFLSRKTIYKYESICYQGMQLIIQFISVAVVIFGGLFISDRTLSLPDLVAFILYVSYVTEPITHLVHMVGQFQDGFACFDRFLEIMAIKPQVEDSPTSLELNNPKGELEFKNVSFSYSEDLSPVLKDLSLKVQPGEQIALVGHSGVGKSTFCSLISRFYDVSRGAIYLDGCDIRELSQDSIHRAVGVVAQNVYLFSGTVFENIAYGRPQATAGEIEQAAKNAGAHDFITALPQGYHTDIGTKGVKLSGGQKQRISIARAFLKNPAILIFDEATSSLDSESEAVVHASLEKLTKGRTTFIIAHRLSTIKGCKRILLVEDGIVAEEGSHSELMELNGCYARLYGSSASIN